MSASNEIVSHYYSGQGIALMADRDSSGNALGFRNIGNVPALSISIDTSVNTHRESTTGQRSIDLRQISEKAATATLTFENIVAQNLKEIYHGSQTTDASGSVTDESITAKLGLTIPLSKIQVSNVVVTDTGGGTTYTEGTDYSVNEEAGSINIIDGGSISADESLEVDFDYAAQEQVDAMTGSLPEKWLRFEGLNTVDDNKPVVVDIFRFAFDPAQEIPLINEDVAGLEVTGSILADQNRSSGSKFFRERLLR